MKGRLEAAELKLGQATATVAELKTTLDDLAKSQHLFQEEMKARAERTEKITKKASKDVQALSKLPDDGCLDNALPPAVRGLLDERLSETPPSNDRGHIGPSATTGLP